MHRAIEVRRFVFATIGFSFHNMSLFTCEHNCSVFIPGNRLQQSPFRYQAYCHGVMSVCHHSNNVSLFTRASENNTKINVFIRIPWPNISKKGILRLTRQQDFPAIHKKSIHHAPCVHVFLSKLEKPARRVTMFQLKIRKIRSRSSDLWPDRRNVERDGARPCWCSEHVPPVSCTKRCCYRDIYIDIYHQNVSHKCRSLERHVRMSQEGPEDIKKQLNWLHVS